MGLKRGVILTVFGALLLALGAGVAVAQGMADLKDKEGKDAGTAQFAEDPKGVAIDVQAKGLEPGEHGIHFHEKGDCSSSDFKSAGDHFNPEDKKHGLENPEGPHAGDLPNLKAKEDGTAAYQATSDEVTLSEGETSLLDSDGSALVIHDKADDQKTDPAGDSGDRVACGEIEKSKGLPKSGGVNVLPLMALLGGAGTVAAILLWRRAFHS